MARIVYDLLFFFIVIIIVLNLIFGVIIDTFADLRSEKTQKEEIPNLDERSAQNRAASNTQQQPQVVETIVRDQPKIGRNDRVTIKNVMSGENKTVKYKQAEPLIAKGEWVLVND